MASQDPFQLALQKNKHWARTTSQQNPSLFPTLAAGQSPQILWIGCADSRLPETTVLGLQPGDVFVHRNIANILPPSDLSSQSVILFALSVLKVKHVVVCGHTKCGGVNAALGNGKLGILDAWLVPLRHLRMEMDKVGGVEEGERARRLVEMNVRKGVGVVRENSAFVEAEAEGREVKVHGLVYDVGTGELTELDCPEEEGAGGRRKEAFRTT